MNLKNFDKKGLMSFNMLQMIPRFLFLVIVIVVVYFLVSIYVNPHIETQRIEALIFTYEMLYSQDGVSYKDLHTNRIFPGVIDAENIDAERLENSIFFGEENRYIAAKITLKDVDKDGKGRIIKSVKYNEFWYDNWEPLAKAASEQDVQTVSTAGGPIATPTTGSPPGSYAGNQPYSGNQPGEERSVTEAIQTRGGALLLNKSFYVVYWYAGNFHPGMLEIDVVVPSE